MCKICDFSKHRAIRIISTIEKDGGQIFSRMRAGGIGKQKKDLSSILLFRGHCFVFSSIRFLSTPVHFCSMFFPQNAAPIFLGLLSPKIRSLLPHPLPGAKMHLTFTLSLEAPCPKLLGKRYLIPPTLPLLAEYLLKNLLIFSLR